MGKGLAERLEEPPAVGQPHEDADGLAPRVKQAARVSSPRGAVDQKQVLDLILPAVKSEWQFDARRDHPRGEDI